MVSRALVKRLCLVTGLIFMGLGLAAPMAFAQEHGEEGEAAEEDGSIGNGLKAMGLGIGAGIAVAGAGLGTGRAQASVGSAGAGALAEKPELFGNILILFAIPETIIILGFVVAFLLLGAM